ncbi:MAG TPA: sortase [Anaerolineae bacterium]|nr:sortase [Anaerolineae bacterium]
MSVRALKIANILIGVGIALLLAGIGLSYPTFEPYLETLFQTRDLATAPPLGPGVLAAEATAAILLPLDEPAPPVPVEPSPTPTTPGRGLEAPIQPQPTPALFEPTSEPSAWPVPWPTPTPLWGTAPVRIRIPAINLDAPVTPVEWAPLETADGAQGIWQVPNWRAAGWHSSSALLGVPGNTVLNGHNTTYGEVFRDLYRLQEGAEILLEGENGLTYTYGVEALYILKEAHQPLEVRLENARYILPTTDERLTLVTCHPYGSIQNRLIVIARPAPAPPSEGEHP